MPHVHILVWLNKNNYDITVDILNRFISAEIPNPVEDPLGYALVAEHMIHGPCGDKNISCPCMKHKENDLNTIQRISRIKLHLMRMVLYYIDDVILEFMFE